MAEDGVDSAPEMISSPIQVNGHSGGGTNPPLKSCMKQSSPRHAAPLQEPLLGGGEEEEDDEVDACNVVVSSREDDGDDHGDCDGDGGGDGDRVEGDCGETVAIDEDDGGGDECKNRKNVQWCKDIAQIREYEQSDREDDGCIRRRECKCTIQ